MSYYLLEYVLVDDYLARRGALREEHLAGIRGSSFEVVEEPAEPPTVASLEFLA